jgi:hypothetical protein
MMDIYATFVTSSSVRIAKSQMRKKFYAYAPIATETVKNQKDGRTKINKKKAFFTNQ